MRDDKEALVTRASTVRLDQPMEARWQSHDLLEFNGNKVRYRIMQDAEAKWHIHRGSDEFFVVLSGELEIDVRDGGSEGVVTSYTLQSGDMIAVHPNTEHRARCRGRVTLLVMDAIDHLG